jgi:hypothetical protein
LHKSQTLEGGGEKTSWRYIRFPLPRSCRIARKAQSHSRTTEKHGLTPPSIYTILSVRATHVSISIYLYTNTNIKYGDIIHPHNPSHAYEPQGSFFSPSAPKRRPEPPSPLAPSTGTPASSARRPSWSDSLPIGEPEPEEAAVGS